VVVRDPVDPVGQHGRGHAVRHQLPRQLPTVPLGQRAAVVIRSLAREVTRCFATSGGKDLLASRQGSSFKPARPRGQDRRLGRLLQRGVRHLQQQQPPRPDSLPCTAARRLNPFSMRRCAK
jgi:hypothetical protein